jgi:tRNA(fMet)-specific endonuclease VapC
MSLYLLDTDTVSLFQRGHPAVCANVAAHSPAEIGIAVLTVEEQLSGWYRELRRTNKPPLIAQIYQRMADTVHFYSQMRIFSFTEPAIERYENLKRLKLGVGKMDLRIGSIALDQNATVVTRNLRDFQRIPDLKIEDWSA